MTYLILVVALYFTLTSLIPSKLSEPRLVTVPVDNISHVRKVKEDAWEFIAHSGHSKFIAYIYSKGDGFVPHVCASGGMVMVDWEKGGKFVKRDMMSHTTYDFLVN